jgi:hypothetical protein
MHCFVALSFASPLAVRLLVIWAAFAVSDVMIRWRRGNAVADDVIRMGMLDRMKDGT